MTRQLLNWKFLRFCVSAYETEAIGRGAAVASVLIDLLYLANVHRQSCPDGQANGARALRFAGDHWYSKKEWSFKH